MCGVSSRWPHPRPSPWRWAQKPNPRGTLRYDGTQLRNASTCPSKGTEAQFYPWSCLALESWPVTVTTLEVRATDKHKHKCPATCNPSVVPSYLAEDLRPAWRNTPILHWFELFVWPIRSQDYSPVYSPTLCNAAINAIMQIMCLIHIVLIGI